jgi:hypothetical protein
LDATFVNLERILLLAGRTPATGKTHFGPAKTFVLLMVVGGVVSQVKKMLISESLFLMYWFVCMFMSIVPGWVAEPGNSTGELDLQVVAYPCSDHQVSNNLHSWVPRQKTLLQQMCKQMMPPNGQQ